MIKPVIILLLLFFSIISISFTQEQNTEQIELGKKLFNQMCLSCHEVTKNKSGPPFQMIREVAGKEWLYKFMRSPMEMMAHSDKHTKKMVNKFKYIMVGYQLTHAQIDAICDYVDSFPYDKNSREYNFRKN